PTMSPMKRILIMADGSGLMAQDSWLTEHRRTHHQPDAISHEPLAIDSNADRPAAPLGDLRDRDTQLAVDQPGARLRHVARGRQADDAGKAAVAALDEMKARFAPRPPRRFLAGNQDAVTLADQAERVGRDPRQVHRDL